MNRGILTINKNGKKIWKKKWTFLIDFLDRIHWWVVVCGMPDDRIRQTRFTCAASLSDNLLKPELRPTIYLIRSFSALILMFVRTFSVFAANCDIGQAWTLRWERRKDLSFVCIRSVGLRTRTKRNETFRQVTTKTNGEHECVADCANMHTMPNAKNEKR